MKAGRELDALVAEKMMGWEKRDAAKSVTKATVFIASLVHTDWFWLEPNGTWHHPSDNVGGWSPPRYSVDIKAAWKVVEKLCNWDVDDNMLVLKGQGPDLEKKEWPDGEAAKWWEAEIGGTWGKVVAEAETAPHAICLAALKAKGIE